MAAEKLHFVEIEGSAAPHVQQAKAAIAQGNIVDYVRGLWLPSLIQQTKRGAIAASNKETALLMAAIAEAMKHFRPNVMADILSAPIVEQVAKTIAAVSSSGDIELLEKIYKAYTVGSAARLRMLWHHATFVSQ